MNSTGANDPPADVPTASDRSTEDREHAVIRLPSRESGWAIIGKGRASAGGMVMMVSGYGRDGEWMAENWPVDWEDQA